MKYTLSILLIILAACAPAPQMTVTPDATATSTLTPPPTETPLPTLTPTPIAVDGIAEDAEGNKLAYLSGEWTALPPLEGEYAKMLQQPDGAVVAVDEDGEVVYELNMAEGEWVEVEQKPEVEMNTRKYEKFNQARDAWLEANPWALEEIDWETFVTERMKDKEGNLLGYGDGWV